MARGRTGAGRAQLLRHMRGVELMRGPVRLGLLSGLRTFRDNIDPGELAHALRTGNDRALMRIIPWDKLPAALQAPQAALEKTAQKGAQGAMQVLPKTLREALAYDLRNPRLRQYIAQRKTELAKTVQQGALAAIRAATRRSFSLALSPRQVALEIKGSIGLNERQAQALANYRTKLATQNMRPGRVAELGDAYGRRLLNSRANMIAQTEVRLAQNQGQLDVWGAAKDDGLLPNGVRKRWAVDGRPCKNLCLPMDGISVGLDEMFKLPDKRLVGNPAESHPHCMCVILLDYG